MNTDDIKGDKFVTLVREALGDRLPGAKVVDSSYGHAVDILLGDECVATVRTRTGSYGYGRPMRIEAFVVKGPRLPRSGASRYGDPSLWRKDLGAAITAALPHMRGKNAHEAAREATEAATARWRIGYESFMNDDAALVALANGDVDDEVMAYAKRVREHQMDQIALGAIVETWNDYDWKREGAPR